MLADYFRDRQIGLFMGDRSEWKLSIMGFPQGSVLGPTLWNIMLDDLLRSPLSPGVELIAYADDVTILIESQSRRGIEDAASRVLDTVYEWGVRNRLVFSPEKSLAMTFRGKLQRPPTIKLGGETIKRVASATVLGVVIDTGLSFALHAANIGERASRCFGKMSRVSASSWGVKYRSLKIIYRGTFVATVTYAAAVWCERASLYVVRSALLRTQRPSLILLTKAYRSVSSAALPVLAGVLPADLEVLRAGRMEMARQNAAKEETGIERRAIWESIIEAWQNRWNNELNGRELFRFFPDVSARLNACWVEPDYETSQILTGHGCFRCRLHAMKLCEISMCECGLEEEDMHHVLWSCPLYEDIRRRMLDGIERMDTGPVYYTDLVSSEANFRRLKEFAHGWHKRRGRRNENL